MSGPKLTAAELALLEANAALRRGDKKTAVAAFAAARAAGASPKLTAQPHALTLSEMDRHDEALEVYRPLYAKAKKDGHVANVMGVLLKRAGRLDQAATVLEEARRLLPHDLSAWKNLGNLHEALGNPEKAALYYRGALKIAPNQAELWRLLGRQHLTLDQNAEAAESFRRGLTLAPAEPLLVAHYVLALQNLGAFDTATSYIASLRAAHPENGDFATVEARLVFRKGDLAQAKAILRAVLARDPGHLDANLLLAGYLGLGAPEEVNRLLEAAVRAHPGSYHALERLIESLARSRYGSEAAHIERAYAFAKLLMERFPSRILQSARTLRTVLMRVLDEDRMAATGDLPALLRLWQAEGLHGSVHYELGQVQSRQDRLELLAWHRKWGERVSAKITPLVPLARPALAGGRKLRVGFMSSDLRNHPITYFTLPLLEGYDRDQVEVYCYSFDEKPADKVRDHLAQQVTAFRLWPQRLEAQIAEGIAADGLDLLFELGGSTAMNKLEVMAYRPARLNASWLGYPHSAGLAQIDYILTDPFTRPEDPDLLIERPFEMPETWVSLSRMFGPTPILEGTPQHRKGHLTFGTANNPYKYTPACLDAWAAVLRAVPGARFLFLRPEGAAPSFIAGAKAAFARRDVDPARLDFIGVRGDHMRHYNEIDIALDSLPHVGGTTTCEALWMGVPTISLVGPGLPERLSYSNLSNAGLGDLALRSRADYVAKAAELAADPARRLALRHGLRAQIAAHPLGQPERFTKNFYDLCKKVASQ